MELPLKNRHHGAMPQDFMVPGAKRTDRAVILFALLNKICLDSHIV
ncbi:hypothetical protein ebA1495 [Aromatoleum aromaticum EbN1]|uniref:Uncharacterized protein n=1 Tax=Aromatoleum aromaticum (strain DSM 19018 / LMG 30748 / EbN1) TaxID=76114 RepID=Q5P6W5_AROAE|nr:hypothetical protein ebA1495 [Aromatoleum aromaticum EbN1]